MIQGWRSTGVVWRRWRCWLVGLLALVVLQELAGAAPEAVRDSLPLAHAEQAELATSDWRPEQLQAWWSFLRASNGLGQTLPQDLRPPEASQRWRTVSLPDVHRGARLPDDAAGLSYQMRWYRFRYAPARDRWPTSLALYLPRLISRAAAVLVQTDEGWRPVFDNQSGANEQWVRPLWVSLPTALTEAHPEREIEIILAVPVQRDGLYVVSSAWLGAREDVLPRFERRWALQVGVPEATGLTLVTLGLFALSLWLRRRREPAYLLFALACAAWLLRNLHYYMRLPRSELLLEWFWWATHASMAWVMLLIFLFALRIAGERRERFERGMLGFVGLSSLAAMPVWGLQFDSAHVLHSANAIVGVLCTGLVVSVAWRRAIRELRLIAAALVMGLVIGIHDLGLLFAWWLPESIYLMPFATLIVLGSFLYAVKHRYVQALQQVEHANEDMAQRLAEQSTTLQAQHDRLREVERQQALLLERQRLMQDMHDGLGSSLLSAMVAVEQGRMPQEEVVEVLRECVDDLRLVIDSLEPGGHDIVSLLATMRYRLGKRLQTAGLVLEWDVQDLPPLDWLEPPDALHVLRLLQEALSNVLKHARAQRVRIATRDLGERIEIRVEDDGAGFDMKTARKGRGLRSQVRRAEHLGGTVYLESQPGQGTRLILRLPVRRPETPRQQPPA